jgi:acyl carrier protein
MSTETEKKVRDYILENFLFATDGTELPGDASFLDMGIIDSTGVLEIIFFVEEEFGIKMDDLDMLPENLDSVNNIVRYVESHRAPA